MPWSRVCFILGRRLQLIHIPVFDRKSANEARGPSQDQRRRWHSLGERKDFDITAGGSKLTSDIGNIRQRTDIEMITALADKCIHGSLTAWCNLWLKLLERSAILKSQIINYDKQVQNHIKIWLFRMNKHQHHSHSFSHCSCSCGHNPLSDAQRFGIYAKSYLKLV